MGRELSLKGGNFPATVKFTKEGQIFVGILDSTKDGKFGTEYQFRVVEGDVLFGKPTGEKDERGNNKYGEVDVKEGEVVRLESSKQLGLKLEQATIGEKISVKFNGWKPNPKGKPYKDFTIQVED